MQYLVEAARGPLPASPEQAITLLEGTVIPHFEYMMKLEREKKILAGGIPVGDRAFVCSSRPRPTTRPTGSSATCPHGGCSNGL